MVANQNNQPEQRSAARKSNTVRNIVVGLFVLIILIGGVFGAYYWLTRNETQPTTGTTPNQDLQATPQNQVIQATPQSPLIEPTPELRDNPAKLIGRRVSLEGTINEQITPRLFRMDSVLDRTTTNVLEAEDTYIMAPAGFRPPPDFIRTTVSVTGTLDLFNVNEYQEGNVQPLTAEQVQRLTGQPIVITEAIMITSPQPSP